jgi:hypothetical protein
MADPKKSDTSTSTPPKTAAATTSAPRGRASESGDPAVHKLLADRQTAVLNGNSDAVKAVDDQLADLGFEVG